MPTWSLPSSPGAAVSAVGLAAAWLVCNPPTYGRRMCKFPRFGEATAALGRDAALKNGSEILSAR
jgi:hypothetical protein